ncbi:ESCRT-I complex subunit VPS28 [Nannochloropsis gaditana CCMP526]|uniref:Vacuolar protein sorting-associated protein 28 homolog n=1 Tax=Nannochloropsis gaditana TaxID=72520 RepID=W7T9L8_9STRA|nr:ESCRT-I complex subunit VPS28 [Nannochloropsis gaditana CCMP526]EKU22796.1 ESCRT-I complex subunit VPS28 [Nannochloropsis gaditana CCMP526]EWM23710.1 Vacuolar protein sorting-associated VPS28 [Nannochloropsis gaditana]|eukprot:XP_005853560.1 ESCRT-I complex subunit VPS28 [Nannochloropsis gaditana CCMP526]
MQPPPYDAAIQQQPSKPPRGKYESLSPTPASMKQEIKLINNAAERRKYEDLADLFSIIKATEHLEIAFARDAISEDDYTAACSKLISQFKSTEAAVLAAKTVADARAFMTEYHMDCPRAVERLLRLGVPSTVLNPSVDDGRGDAIKVAETVQYFITAMDGVRLEQRAVDELQPMLTDIMTSLRRVQGLPAEFLGSKKLEEWLVTLNAMRAMDAITEEQARQLLFDLDQGYSSFHAWLKSLD